VAVPIARFLARLVGCCGKANDLGINLMVNYPSALLICGRNKSTKVVSPRVKWADFGDAVITHDPQASFLKAKQELKLHLISNSQAVAFANFVFQRDVVGPVSRGYSGLILPPLDHDLACDHAPAVGELLFYLVYLAGIFDGYSYEVKGRRSAPLKDFSGYFKLHARNAPDLCQNLAVNKALMLVDLQFCMVFGQWPVPGANELLPRIANRLLAAREAGETIVFVQNDAPEGELDAPGMPYWQLALQPALGEMVVRKTHQDVFESNPSLASLLRDSDVSEIELVGFQSELCLRASAIGAANAGFQVSVSRDLHGTYDGDESHTEISNAVQRELEALTVE